MRNNPQSTFALWLTLGILPIAAAASGTGCSVTGSDEASASADALGACGQGSRDGADDADDDDDDGDDGSRRKSANHAKCGKARRDAGKTSTSDGGTTTKPDASTTTDAGSTVDAAPGPAPAPTPTPTPTTCTSFTYSAWGPCQPNGTQTRTLTSSSPAGCTGGTPVLTQSCTYIDGAALYTQYCSGCHGTSKKGSSAASIQSAIDKNIGGMGSLKSLTAAQIQAISAAP